MKILGKLEPALVANLHYSKKKKKKKKGTYKHIISYIYIYFLLNMELELRRQRTYISKPSLASQIERGRFVLLQEKLLERDMANLAIECATEFASLPIH
jgi:hypothetical protein